MNISHYFTDICLTQKIATRVQEEIEGREQDRVKYEIDIRTKDKECSEQIGRMCYQMAQFMERLEKEKCQRADEGWSIRIGPITIGFDWFF